MYEAEPTIPVVQQPPATAGPTRDFGDYLGSHLGSRVRATAFGLCAGYVIFAAFAPANWPLLVGLGVVSIVPGLMPSAIRRTGAEGFAGLQGVLGVAAALLLPSVPLLATAVLACMLHAIVLPMRPTSRAITLALQGVLIAVLAVQVPLQVPLLAVMMLIAYQFGAMQLAHWRTIWDDRHALNSLREQLHAESRQQKLALRERERELLEQQERMVRQEQWATLGRVAAGVGHEIKNPLQAAMADLETARRTSDITLVDDAQASLFRIRDLLTDLSQLRGKDREDVENYGLREVVDAALRGAMMGIQGLRVSVGTMPDVPVRVNQARLTQVLANLLTNAWHAVERRGHGEVRIHAALSAQRIFMYVDDDGPGVPDTAWERVFEAFVTTKSAGRGTGLGLPVSRGLMRAMGGDLWLDRGSQLGGARLVLALAYAPSDAPRERVRTLVPPERQSSPRRPARTSAISPSPSPTRHHGVLLIVDDDPRVRRSLQRMAGESWTVLAAANSVRARELASKHPVDVVLCDLHLVREDAVDVLEVLRSVRPELVQRTVLMSGEPTSARLLALAEANPNRLLGKPFDRKAGLALLLQARNDALPFLELPDMVNTPASVAAIEPAWRFDPPTEETVVVRDRDGIRHLAPALSDLPGGG